MSRELSREAEARLNEKRKQKTETKMQVVVLPSDGDLTAVPLERTEQVAGFATPTAA